MSFAGSSCLLVCYRDLRTYRNFEAHELSYEQWKSVLHLSTRWGFDSLRKLAIKSIKPPTSYDQLVLARTYSVEQWILPALSVLCSRALPLSLDEARQMDIEDVILVAAVREEIRGDALRVDAADIPRHVEMALANNRLVSKVHGSAGQESGSTADPVSKSVNASTTDLLGDNLNANSASKHASAEGESQLPPMDEALQTEKLDGNPSEEVHPREHLTLTTEVPVAAHVATAGPTTAGDSRDGGGRSEGEGRESGDKIAYTNPVAFLSNRAMEDCTIVGAPITQVAEDDWGIPVRTKKKGGASAATPVIPCDGGGDDGWGIPVRTKKKGSASAATTVTSCAGGGDDGWGIPVRTKKKGGASASTPIFTAFPGF